MIKNDKMIKQIILMLVIASVVIFLNGCYVVPCIVGSGNVISETRDAEDFHSVSLEGQGNIYFTQDSTQDVRIEAEDNIVDVLRTRVVNGVLIIDVKDLRCLSPKRPINIYVSTDEVKKLSIIGSGNIIGQNEIETDSLELIIAGSGDVNAIVDAKEIESSIIGSGDINLMGKTIVHEATITGSGNINCFELETDISKVNIYGSGSAEVSAEDELDIVIAGSGDVYYKGDPLVEQKVSGSGRVKGIE